jgi:outer membrane protein assembly factor BamB
MTQAAGRLLVLLAVAAATRAGAQAPSSPPAPAWPQWGGPTRDFKTTSKGLAATWPASGPRELWSRPLGDGYSSLEVDEGTIYTMYRPAGLVSSVVAKLTSSHPEVVIALDAATGETRWQHTDEAPPHAKMDMQFGPGPHATPLVVGDLVYTVGTVGTMNAFEKKTGKVAWSHGLWSELGGTVMGRGYSCSPIAYGDTVIVTVGGKGQTLVAFDRKDGRVVWKGGDLEPAPSSPLLISVDGQDQLVLFHAEGIAGFDPRTGALLWNHPHKTDYGLNISLPVWGEGNLLFVSSAYSGGSRVLELHQAAGKTTVNALWASNRMRIHIGNAIRIGDTVYGSSGDFGPAPFTAVNVRTGEVAWRDRAFGRATSVYADGKLIVLDEDGTLALATVSPEGLKVLAKATVFRGRSWTAPTLVGTRLFLRDRATIKALEVGAAP